MIMFNITGPLSLVVAGLYFYKRGVPQDVYFHQMKWAFLPAFTIIAALSVVASLATVEFTSVQSSSGASGGFGPNQVSTVLGWFIMLALLYKINGEKITPFSWLDWVMLFYLVLRALLTFSRGGVMGSTLALLGSITVLYFAYPGFRRQLFKSMPYVTLSLAFFVGVFLFANHLTNNFLLYRYQGLSTTEALTGVRTGNSNILTGRDEIMKADFRAFLEHPGFGVGYGMAEKYRVRYYGSAAAAHTEFARLLSEHGILGLLFMLVGMLGLPLYFLLTEKHPLTRCFLVAFYLLSMFTMFHAAMRLALPGVLFGAAFMRFLPNKSEAPDNLKKTL
ncbi:oligosaccharide repeat unit polymerase Wzy [Geofilum rubicundum JCM 15548]|uniref:Oligosaccharide repeat unit polymerase Wzy n=2 Tax=Geofilum TaxID=1236988 RepID=A0A0E9LSH8_9BACT|nr:oligosaccharide repeat unit polymerase Wzy [Geofilum rubicundum JCM 15548]